MYRILFWKEWNIISKIVEVYLLYPKNYDFSTKYEHFVSKKIVHTLTLWCLKTIWSNFLLKRMKLKFYSHWRLNLKFNEIMTFQPNTNHFVSKHIAHSPILWRIKKIAPEFLLKRLKHKFQNYWYLHFEFKQMMTFQPNTNILSANKLFTFWLTDVLRKLYRNIFWK